MARAALASSALAVVALAAIALAPEAARAQAAPSARASFDRRGAEPGDVVSYTITISGSDLPRASGSPSPDLSGFRVVAGPSFGRSHQISMVNGRTTQTTVYTYTWSVLPKTLGDLTVPAFDHALGELSLSVPAASVSVAERSAGADGGPGGAPPDDRSPAPRGRREGRRPWEPAATPANWVRVRAEVDDARPWVGEEIVVTHWLEYSGEVRSFTPVAPAEFAGFAKTQREVQPRASVSTDERTGERYQRAPVERWAVVPLASGRKEMPPYAYRLEVARRQRDPFGSFDIFGLGAEPVLEATEPLAVDVRPLPAGAPASFAGAVGSYQLAARLTASEVTAGDGLTLRVTVSGTGSFRDVTAPEVSLPPGLRVFPAEVNESTQVDAAGHTTGRKTFDFPLLVMEAGRHELPPVEWTFFEPRSGRYVTRVSDPLGVTAAPGQPSALALANAEPAVAVLQVEQVDIHHVRARLDLERRWQPSDGWPRWLLLGTLGPGLLLGAGALRVARDAAARRDPAARRAQRALARARGRLRAARQHARAGRRAEAADAVARAVAGLVADRLSLGEGEPSPAETGAAVARRAGQEAGDRVRAFLADCDFARFAGGGEDPAELVARGERLTRDLAGLAREGGEAA